MSLSETDLRRRDRLTVVDADGEEQEVYGWVTVQRTSRVRGSNPYVEHFEAEISAGDAVGLTPEAVTHWVAEELQHEFGIDVTEHGIDVIDPTDEGVSVL